MTDSVPRIFDSFEPNTNTLPVEDQSRPGKSLRVQAPESEYEVASEVHPQSVPAGPHASTTNPQSEVQELDPPKWETIRHEVDLVSDKHPGSTSMDPGCLLFDQKSVVGS